MPTTTPNNGQKLHINVTHIGIRLSITFLVARIFIIQFLSFVLFVIAHLVFEPLDGQMGTQTQIISAYNISFLFVCAFQFVFILFVIFRWLNEYWEIYPTELIFRYGIIWRHRKHYRIANIVQFKLDQSFWGQIFNYGHIEMFDYSTKQHIYMNYIHNPQRYFDILHGMRSTDIEENKMRDRMRDNMEADL